MTVLKNILTTYIPNLPLEESEDEEPINDVATTSDTKKSTPMLCRRSVLPRIKLLIEKRQNANSQSKSVYSEDQIGYGTPHQRSTYTRNTDFVNQIQHSFSLMPSYSSKTRFTVEQQI